MLQFSMEPCYSRLYGYSSQCWSSVAHMDSSYKTKVEYLKQQQILQSQCARRPASDLLTWSTVCSVAAQQLTVAANVWECENVQQEVIKN